VVTRGTAVANPGWAHAVHVEVAGLRPGRWYWYQFRVGSEVSPKGRTRTFPAPTELPERLRFAFASCQHYESGLYTAYEHMVREDLDLIVHLGDYIYEGGVTAGRTRKHNGAEIRTLDDYRARHALYRLDPALQAAHAAAPWLVTWDDHEVVNNYAGDIPQDPDRTTREQFLRRRAAPSYPTGRTFPCTAARPPAASRISTCSTPASTGATSRSVTAASRRIPRYSILRERSSARRNASGSAKGWSVHPRPGTSSPSR